MCGRSEMSCGSPVKSACIPVISNQHPVVAYRNSEIYNHEELKQRYLKGVDIVKNSKSDSAIVGHMYEVRMQRHSGMT